MEYTVSNVHECFENCVIMFQQQAESKNQTISLTEQIMYPYVYMDELHLSEVCLKNKQCNKVYKYRRQDIL